MRDAREGQPWPATKWRITLSSNVDLVKDIYEKFTAGDVASILANFEPDIEFRLAEGHPYQPSGQPWFGKEAVTQNFFTKAGPEWARWSVVVGEVVEAANAVVVECRYTGAYKPTGKALDVQVCHVWKLRNGKIRSFHQYLDTARLQEVMRGL
jgi:ketosteroid isomerase-like protein